MTIGIGVLCSTYYGPPNYENEARPNALVMISDTMGSTETDSTAALHKMFCAPPIDVYAVGADGIDHAGELFSTICQVISMIAAPKTHGAIWKALCEAVDGYRRERFHYEVLGPKFMYLQNQVSPSAEQDLRNEWSAYEIGADLLVGAFDDSGVALLYYVGRVRGNEGFVHGMEFPGHAAIGSGGHNAAMWMHYREQHLARNITQSALHAFEASQFAARSPFVNENPELLIAMKGKYFHEYGALTPPDSPISLDELRRLAKKHAPRSTDDVGFPKPKPSKANNS